MGMIRTSLISLLSSPWSYTLFLLLLDLVLWSGRGAATAAVLHSSYPRVIIIGGGPAGLTSAIALSSLGWEDITVLEVFTILQTLTALTEPGPSLLLPCPLVPLAL